MNFNGISRDAIFLLAINRFNDSKEFYEENKDAIRDGIVIPLRQLVVDLTETMQKINPDMIINPIRCISRVRRDTRYTHDKSLYRENMWIMFRHAKNHLPTAGMWLEIEQNGFDYGCGVISSTPAFMEQFRLALAENPDRFLNTVKSLKRKGFKIEGNYYKKSKADAAGIDGEIKKWYDLKEVFVIKHHDGIDLLDKPKELLDMLKKDYKSLSEFYKYLHQLTITFNAENWHEKD